MKISALHKVPFILLLLACIITFFSVSENTRSKPENLKRFSLLKSSETGILFNNKIKDTKESNILLYANFYGGAGVGVGDFNNDGLQDVYFAGNMTPDKLYFNQGSFKFKDVTTKAGITDDGGWSTGVTVADIDNDGDLDIYISRELHDNNPEWRRNLLYINDGRGNFTEKAKEFQIANTDRTRHATFLDYDKDGKLDLLLLTQPPNPGSVSPFLGADLAKPEYAIKLLKNKGDFFKDITLQAGISKTGFPNSVSVSDLNNDGWPDIYVTNDFYAPDFVFINNGNGTFIDKRDAALKQTSFYSMGIDIADINNDLLPDIFVLDMVSEDNFRLKSNMSGMNIDSFWKVVDDGGGYQYMYNTLQINNGNGTFSNTAQYSNMAATDWSWSNLLADFDNDGLKDAYITNGLYHDIRNTDADKNVAAYINRMKQNWLSKHPDGGNLKSIWDIVDLDKVINLIPSKPLQNYAYKNLGTLNFKKVAQDWGLEKKSFSNGSAYADLDNDGDLDLIVNNINSEAFIYKNNSEKFNNTNYLRVQLEDHNNNTVFGTKVTLFIGDSAQLYESTNVRGMYSTSEPYAHFGLGHNTTIDSLIVSWPNNTRTKKTNITANQTLKLFMNQGVSKANDTASTQTKITFEACELIGITYKHQENDFDDFSKQILLPHKLSQLGPALAVADVNNDTLDDVFIGGATGYSPALYIQNIDGTFTSAETVFWIKEKHYEDVDAEFIDINGDGYKDLYVVSGGNAFPENDAHYNDRLYLNDGKGAFLKGAILNLNRVSGSAISAEDYDNDGDIDIFIAGRHSPHNYPSPATSTLLINENGQLINSTNELAPELKNIGMVTDATWSDYDKDGDKDLILVGEWMPITIFNNENGILKKITITALENLSGWWFSIEKGDFDNDGDDDYIAGNLGLNYKYKTSAEKPFDLYYDDFDQNGTKDIVLGYYNKDKHYPLRGFSCSSQQIPSLKSKIGKYDLFADMAIDAVYGANALKKANYYKAETFASIYIENNGEKGFKISQLPYEAQLSNINDILAKDINNDGNLDVIAVENFYESEIETPRNDAGKGIYLLGNGKGAFSAEQPIKSGFFANGNAKKIKYLKNKEKKLILVANNNGKLTSFSINK